MHRARDFMCFIVDSIWPVLVISYNVTSPVVGQSNRIAPYRFTWSDSGGRFKNTYELLNLRALKFSHVNKICIFQCMCNIFCVEFQRYPLKFYTKYLTHILKDMISIKHWNFRFKSSYVFLKRPPDLLYLYPPWLLTGTWVITNLEEYG